jgi:hypothetical protein
MMKLKMLAVFAALAFALPATAQAQNKHSHSHTEKGAHGGRMADAGDYHVELLARDGGIEVYVVDHSEKPLSLAGFKGLAILSVDGKSQRITLDAGDGSKMTGKVTGNLPKQPKGVVQITPPAGKTVSAKF